MPDYTRTTISLPADLKQEARIKALHVGKSLSQVIRELLAAWLVDDTPASEQEQET